MANEQISNKQRGFISRLIIRLIINSCAIYVAALIIPGIHIGGWKAILLVAAIFGLVNALIRPFVSGGNIKTKERTDHVT